MVGTGSGFTVMVAEPATLVLRQYGPGSYLTELIVYSNAPGVTVDLLTVTLALAFMYMVISLPPFIRYLNLMRRSCGLEKVTVGEGSFWQTEVVPLTVAIGVASTVTVAEGGVAYTFSHVGELWYCTLVIL